MGYIKIKEPTPWCFAIVVMQKNRKIRICVDLINLNKTIMCEKTILPQ